MRLLFVLSSITHNATELISMAQLSAAFGQEVALLSADGFDSDTITRCIESDIHQFYSLTNNQPAGVISVNATSDLLSQFDRIIRL